MSLNFRMKFLYERNLRHRVDHHPTIALSPYGEPTFSPTSTELFCFIAGAKERPISLSPAGEVVTADWKLFLKADAAVSTGDLFKNGRTVQGELLLETARVVRVKPLAHPASGLIGKVAYAVRTTA